MVNDAVICDGLQGTIDTNFRVLAVVATSTVNAGPSLRGMLSMTTEGWKAKSNLNSPWRARGGFVGNQSTSLPLCSAWLQRVLRPRWSSIPLGAKS